ncbi:MAG: InlB B-repeat-containing protein, partial [Lachnospiraceae bacterium]|nr:InlB B-repeat-containing protein [Lachnospiraceae bacterium]
EFFTVTFDLNGKPGTAPAAQTVEKDGCVKEPAVPEADGFTFIGWFTDAACKTRYDFSTPVTTDLTLYAGWKAVAPEPVVIDEGDAWNLYEDASEHEYQILGIRPSETVANSNVKSKAYYDAKITGSTITVKVTGDRKKAALAANTILEFDLGSAGVVEYTLPVSYVKPVFKLSSTTATIRTGKETTLKTTVLVKNADGSFAPYDMTDVTVSGSGLGTVTKGEDGSIEIRTSTAGKGKISIVKDAWDGAKAVNLAYTVKGSQKDVLSVDLQGLKTVVVNSNAKGQAFGFDVMFNGASVSSSDLLPIVDKKNTGLATISDDGKLVIAYKDGIKNGTYTVTLQSKESKEAKTNVKIRVNGKKLDKAITTRILRKYDVVTKQSMVVVPNLKDVGGRIETVSVAEEGFTAKLNAAGNIEIDYIGDTNDTESSNTSEKNGVESAGTDAANAAENASTEEKYNVKNLNIGTLTLSLTITGIDDPVTLPLKNVRAKKTTPTAKVGIVTIPAGVTPAEGQVIGTANIVSTYKVSSGMYRTIRPVKSEILGTPKGVTAKPNENDPSEIAIYSITKKNASFRVKLTYAGGVTKTVTVRVKKK